ncbi:hypothetical protein HPB50_018883 [Hyalomma asiaticum]|uniref:Uncharacterized protein n=1 Tax=Hyalomma asiaticum TaxID=266040 RepID=A0ACB7RPC5_HYAAI|nr:hypothetical protein HPB50_018883 [Hyalomma asiaticum]
MEVLKKKRKVIRFQVTRFTNDADKLLSSTSAIDLDEDEASEAGAIKVRRQEKELATLLGAVRCHYQQESGAEQSRPFQLSEIAAHGGSCRSDSGLQATSQCYGDAIDILQKSFGDSSALIQDHMQGLIDISPVSSEKNVRDLRRMLDSVQVHMRDLKALGVGEESYEDAASMTSSSSRSSQRPPLRHLLGLFEIELESRERTMDDRPDNASGERISRDFAANIKGANGRYEVELLWKNEVDLATLQTTALSLRNASSGSQDGC